MDKNIPPLRLQDAFDVIRELREDVARHEKVLEKIMASLGQQSEPSWIPSQGMGGMIERIQPSYKIRKVETLQTKPHELFARLRTTRLGRVYTSHLKQYHFVRWIVQWIWRNGYPVYANHLATRLSNRTEKRWRPLTKLSEFVKKGGIPTYKLADAVLVETPVPKVFPSCDQDYLVSPDDRYRFPEIFVATISNAMTYGGTNLILAGGEVVCHDLYDFERDYTSEELHGRTLIDPKARRIRWLLVDETPEPIPIAAAFVDACAINYAHWITEVLPRVALFCAEERFQGVPIVVNDGLHKNIMESLILVAGADREIITLPIGRALAVSELYLTSVAGYVPFERRTNKLSGHSHGLFSPRAFEIIRNHLNALWQKTEEEAWPEKIFLRRNSGTRKVTNAAEIEKLLVARGYAIVEPEKLSFLQQFQLFNNAKVIVSSTGASLANAIGCKPGAQVVVLMSKHRDMIYRYWSDLLSPFGIRVSYALGNIIENHDRGIHGDFAVDTDCISDLLNDLENK